jgi:hypothetical protein
VLAGQLTGVRALGVELLGLLAFAIRVPVELLSAFVPLVLAARGTREWFTHVYTQQRAL